MGGKNKIPNQNSKKASSIDKKKDKKPNVNEGEKKPKLKPATSIESRHILCKKESNKNEALQALKDGGRFDEVAKKYSEDKARHGGSLGWKPRNTLLAEYEKIAYDLETSKTDKPIWGEVKTSFGYHIIMVEDRK